MSLQIPSVEAVLAKTVEVAREHNHRVITNDHLFYAFLTFDVVDQFLSHFGTNVSTLVNTFENHFENDTTREQIDSTGKQIRSASFNRVFEQAKTQSIFLQKNEFDYLDLLNAVLTEQSSASRFVGLIEQAGGDIHNITASLEAATIASKSLGTDVKNKITKALGQPEVSNKKSSSEKKETKTLNEFCTNLNELAAEGKLNPVVGRDKEVAKIIQTLARKDKQNIIICGESGIGKTAIADGFVQRIISGNVPEEFKDAVVYSLDVGGLVAGTRYRGEFEERMKGVIDEVKKNPNAILFIDEIHMIRGAGGSSENAMDAANILKPALASRAIRVIGATTHDEYRKHFEKDKALMRRFYKMDVHEPSISETKEIVRGALSHFEDFHKVSYDLDGVDLAVDLAAKYLHDRRFPDKAFDIIDGVGARIKLLDREEKHITIEDIETEVSILAKIPDISVKVDETAKLKLLEENLKAKVFGQDTVVEQLVSHVLVAKSGLRAADKPLLSALFRGQSGTGKTELAKQLAKELNIEFVRFDMSEYQEKHSVSRLIGAPPGYVGHGEGTTGNGLLINAIETTPHCVLLLDEIEKADPQVLNILLQVMDYGMLTSSSGKVVSFRNAIILMSSNLGAKEKEKRSIGFGMVATENTAEKEATEEFFAPEFRARLDLTVSFNNLNTDVLYMVIDKFVKETNDMLKSRDISVTLTQDVKDYFISQVEKLNLGARPVNAMIAKEIKQPLSKMILFDQLEAGSEVLADLNQDGQIFLSKQVTTVEEPQQPQLAE